MFIICTILYSCNGIRSSLVYGRSNFQYLFKSNHTVLLALFCCSALNAALRSTIQVWYLDNVSKGSKMGSENTKTLLWRIIVTCVIMKATFFNTQRDVTEFA
jgi:Na+/alanine symporter